MNAKLVNAKLSGADVWNTNFKGAKLLGTIMICNRISDVNLTDAIFDNNTKWPKGFNPIEKGAKNINEV